ncbi:hypothetical protein DR950_36090 [Kitasatospora xanthocidica]|uniref:Gp28/Gp37-like domain-containing protein n=1 Tax=Kitasatospora xanthocidica TaxID=83382 RepID=A0A373A2S3_9ACTN|nr:siphovirus ReqiPepy6 Gp37-like family protein [Kitasatospora xanthocidica]RGD62458.1 hypothetical protein DR950_36090 [Kitasatospora xanthocidica]
MSEYRVLVRDRDLNPIGQVDDFLEFQAVLRYCDTGHWQIKIMAGTPHAQLFQPGHGIVAYREGVDKPIASGPIQTVEKYWTVDTDSGPGGLIISGCDDNYILEAHVAYPNPELPVTNQDRASYTNGGVRAAQAVEEMVSRNAGALALDGRTPARFGTPDGDKKPWHQFGKVTPFNLQWDNLRDGLKPVCDAGNVGWRTVYDAESRTIQLDVFEPQDRSGHIRFSADLGNLKEFVYSLKAPKYTRAIVAAQGQGAERYIKEYIDRESEEYWGIISELFVDARDIPVKKVSASDGTPVAADEDVKVEDALAALDAKGQQALLDNGPQGNLQLYPIDTPQQTFGKDWFLGDTVTCIVDGEEHRDIVRQVTIEVNSNGHSITPVIGDQGTDSPANVFNEIKKLWQRVRELSARV